MLDLDAFNGFWVVCEANYVADPDRDSFYRSIFYLTDAYKDGDEGVYYAPLFTEKSSAEKCRDLVCAAVGNSPTDWKVVPIASLAGVADTLKGLVRAGRLKIKVDDGAATRIEVLLDQVVERLR